MGTAVETIEWELTKNGPELTGFNSDVIVPRVILLLIWTQLALVLAATLNRTISSMLSNSTVILPGIGYDMKLSVSHVIGWTRIGIHTSPPISWTLYLYRVPNALIIPHDVVDMTRRNRWPRGATTERLWFNRSELHITVRDQRGWRWFEPFVQIKHKSGCENGRQPITDQVSKDRVYLIPDTDTLLRHRKSRVNSYDRW